MGVRYKNKRRCRNCPETKEGLPTETQPRITTYEGEGCELWNAALVGCGTLFELLFRYVSLDVPGKPLPQLERLQIRLGEIVKAREERENARQTQSDGSAG
jgi:hypothetical protein